MKRLVILLLAMLCHAHVEARDVRVLVDGIAPATGTVYCALFSKERGFPFSVDRADARVSYPVSGELLTCTFPDVAPGRYAIAAFQDLDEDGEFDGRFDGDSTEAWGVTNNIRPGDRAPQFVEAVIYVGSIVDYELRLQR